jgi:hypothetical protein
MDNERQKFQAPETSKVPNEAEKKKMSSLYDIEEIEGGGFNVVLPGLIDKKSEAIVGTSRQRFETREEAELAVEQARESVKVQLEKASIEKTFTPHFYNIKRQQDDTYRVTVPGAKSSDTGYFMGSTHFDFSSWEEARDFYLNQRENNEQLTGSPLLEMKINDNESISFSDFNNFNPSVAPTGEKFPLAPSVEKYLATKQKEAATARDASTYQNTINEKGWETRIFNFVSEYLRQEGSDLVERLKINDLTALSPKQAIELSNQIVLNLTKYKRSGEEIGGKADQSSALNILKSGRVNLQDPNWEGIGVCRNFASTVKAVFEAFKANQTKFNQLNNTYCLYENGFEHKPQRGRQFESGEHAWNTFVTVSKEGRANATITDVTWAKQNLETKAIENVDYTLTRMEPIVHAISQNGLENAPQREKQLGHVLSYYLLKIENPGQTGGHVEPDAEKQFFMSRALKLIQKNEMFNSLPDPLIKTLAREYPKSTKDADPSEISALWNIHKNVKGFPIHEILKAYVSKEHLSVGYSKYSLIFADNELQKMVFEHLKGHKDFERLLKEDKDFRSRMKEVLPQLFAENI